jgi:long-subunit fatty acid transport protein
MGLKYKFNDKWDAKLLEEVHFNAGKNIVNNTFDQNRLSFGLNHNISKTFSFETGYLFWFQQQATGTDFYSRNIVYFSLKQNLKLY